MCEAQHRLYQQLVGIAEWAVQIGRFDTRYALTSLNHFSAAPREGHLSRLVMIFDYLQNVTGRRKSIVVSPQDIYEISGKGAKIKYWLEKYPKASENIYKGLPYHRGSPLSTAVYFDSDHAHDQIRWRSFSGALCFVGSDPISWNSKRQGTIEISSYSAELCAGRVATEEAIALRYMFRSLDVPVKVATALCGDKPGIITYFTNLL